MSLLSKLRCLWTMGQGMVRGLPDATADRDPLDLFTEWFTAAHRAGLFLPEAMTLATVGEDGAPSARMMLLKGWDECGFTFFTNYDSHKGRGLESNSRVALVLHWGMLERQVRIEGRAERLSEEESRVYFHSRPRGSQIGAWASKQSDFLDDRKTLQKRWRKMEARFKDSDIPLPPFWGGFRVVPSRIEFWQGRANRLHDRLRFNRAGKGWTTERLYP